MQSWIITGGLACGKSSLSKELLRIGGDAIAFFSCDEAAARLWGDPAILKLAAAEFGPAILHPDGSVNRERLREIVFADPEARLALEAFLHPPILGELEAARSAALQKSPQPKVFLAEVPLYHEIRPSVPADMVIVVAASRAVQRNRLMEHRGLDADTSEKMLDAQLPLEVKTGQADAVVWNDGSPAMLEAQALALVRDRWTL